MPSPSAAERNNARLNTQIMLELTDAEATVLLTALATYRDSGLAGKGAKVTAERVAHRVRVQR